MLVTRERRVERWFLRRLLAPHGRRERLLVRYLGGSLAAAALLLRRVPVEEARAAQGALAAAARAAERGLGASATLDGGGWILALASQPSAPRLVALGFGRGEGAPGLVLKAAWRGSALAREAAALGRVRRGQPAAIGSTLPEVAGHWPGEPEVLATSALPGRSAYVALRRARDPEAAAVAQLGAASRWLTAFQSASREEPARPWVPAPWTGLAPRALRDRPEPAWLVALRQRVAEAPHPALPCHGDFWARNVLLGEDGEVAGVVDWESSHEGSPLGDIVHFAFAHAQLLGQRRRLDPVSAFRAAFLDEGRLAAAARAAAAATPYGGDGELRLAALRLHLLDGAAGRLAGAGELPVETWLACDAALEEGACAFSG